jgi:hypothetical protein
MIRTLLLGALLLGASFSFAQDWKDRLRLATAIDYFQTEQFVKRRPLQVIEANPALRQTTSLETALIMALDTEVCIRIVESLPRRARPWAGALLVLYRSSFAMQNAHFGAPQPFYLPLISTRF